MIHPHSIRIEDYDYYLPEERIAKFPKEKRDQSKLLIYQNGQTSFSQFSAISNYLNSGDLLIINETKVIPARLYFQKDTGANIEILCLSPSRQDYESAMNQNISVDWNVMIGGAKKWKSGILEKQILHNGSIIYLRAEKIETEKNFVVRFTWSEKEFTFSDVLQIAGEIPLPPYFERKATALDEEMYQTVFARNEGSVAAPTAALHFTSEVFRGLKMKGVGAARLTLHVGSGTFKPVSSETMEAHEMHSEYFEIPMDLLIKLSTKKGRIIPVGTTSLRTLESAYWLGVKLIYGKEPTFSAVLKQWDAYELPQDVPMEKAFEAIYKWCSTFSKPAFVGHTALLIAPGYKLRVADALITNFHLPKSTLILLVAALVGDKWRDIYEEALKNNFDFLSYGDSSLLIP